MKTKKKRKSTHHKYRPRHAITIYQLAADGLAMKEICSILKITMLTFRSWRASRKLVKYAYEQGKKRADSRDGGSVRDYIYGRLPKKMQKCWNRIDDLDEHPNSIVRINKLLRQKGAEGQKAMYLHALTESHFSPSDACKRTCIPYTWVKNWIEEDFGFAQLIQEIQFHKKNLGETQLMKLVKAGDPGAVIFFNKTLNKDRGYGDSITMKHEGEIKVTGSHTIELGDELMALLTRSAQRELVSALDTLERQQLETKEGLPVKMLEDKRKKESA